MHVPNPPREITPSEAKRTVTIPRTPNQKLGLRFAAIRNFEKKSEIVVTKVDKESAAAACGHWTEAEIAKGNQKPDVVTSINETSVEGWTQQRVKQFIKELGDGPITLTFDCSRRLGIREIIPAHPTTNQSERMKWLVCSAIPGLLLGAAMSFVSSFGVMAAKALFGWPTHHLREYLRLRKPPRPALEEFKDVTPLDLSDVTSMRFTELRYVHLLHYLILVGNLLIRLVKILHRIIRISKIPVVASFPPAMVFYVIYGQIVSVIKAILAPVRLFPVALFGELELDLDLSTEGAAKSSCFAKLKSFFSTKPLNVLIELTHANGSVTTLLAKDCRHRIQKALDFEIGGYLEISKLNDGKLLMWTEVDYVPLYDGKKGQACQAPSMMLPLELLALLHQSFFKRWRVAGPELSRSALSLVGRGSNGEPETLATQQLCTGKTDSYFSYLRKKKITNPRSFHPNSGWSLLFRCTCKSTFRRFLSALFDKRHHVFPPDALTLSRLL